MKRLVLSFLVLHPVCSASSALGMPSASISLPRGISPVLPIADQKTGNAENLKQVQRALTVLGYYTGKADGIIGPRTEHAVFQFLKDIGHKGAATQDVLQKIYVAADIKSARNISTKDALMLVPLAAEADTLMDEAGLAYRKGNYEDASRLITRALGLRERSLGKNDRATLKSVCDLGRLYTDLGRYKKAEPLLVRGMEGRERLLGKDHPHTLAAVGNLGILYNAEGRYADAEPLIARALAGSERILGKDDPETLTQVYNMAFLYKSQAQYAKAEPFYIRALEGRERILGKDHTDTLRSVNALAGLYMAEGRYAKAEPLYVRALEGYERAFGKDHPDTLYLALNLGSLYKAQRRFNEAEPLYVRALHGFEGAFGSDFPGTLTAANNLANIYENQGRLTLAGQLLAMVLESRERVLGEDHPDTLTSTNNLAALYGTQSLYTDAEALYRRALEGRERVMGPDHPDTLSTVNNLALLYWLQGRNAEAEPLLLRALEGKERTLGADHTRTLRQMDNLGYLYWGMGKYDEALRTWEKGFAALPAWMERSGYEPGSTIRWPMSFAKFLETATRSGFPPEETGRITFEAQGWLTYNTLDKTLADLGARLAATDPAASHLIRTRQELGISLQGLRDRYAKSFSDTAGGDTLRKTLRDQIDETEREIGKTEARIEHDFPDLADLSSPRPLSIEEAQDTLEPNEALIAYAWTTKTLYAWFIRTDVVDWAAIPIDQSNVAGLVAGLRYSVDFSGAPFAKAHPKDVSKACSPKASIPGPDNHDFNLCEANDLYRVLLQPFEDKLKGVDHLIVVPDGALEQLPFSLLTRTSGDGAEPHWLIEDMAITMLPTTSSLRLLRSAQTRSTAGRKPYLGIAPVDFQKRPKQAPLRGTLASLPGTLAEVRRLSEITGAGADGYVTGEKASEAFVKSGALERYRVLSFATHGLLSEDTEILTNGAIREPALALAPANDDEDGFLTATEAATLKLNADWVLLSACNTAAGDGEGAEGLSGLARAFFFAGARSLLVSHWAIDDNAAVDLMAETIRRTSDGTAKDKAEALRAAMLAVMKKPGYRHPYFWAPFSLVGDNRISGRTSPPHAGKGGS